MKYLSSILHSQDQVEWRVRRVHAVHSYPVPGVNTNKSKTCQNKNYKNTLLSATEKLPLRQKTRQLYPECFKRISIKTFTGGSLVPHLWQIFSKCRAAVFPSPGGVSMLEIIAGLIPVRLAGDNGKPIHVFLSNRFHSRPCVRKLLVSFF